MDKLKRKLSKVTKPAAAGQPAAHSAPAGGNDTPETVIQRAIHGFTHTSDPGDEVLHLPAVVDNAESSPAAAQIAATNIRKLLDMSQPPKVQYQAIMLARILSDNPGPSFTRYIGSDAKYPTAIKELIRRGRDPGVWGILRETLIHWEGEKEDDPGLQKVREMWLKEKKAIDAVLARSGASGGASPLNHAQNVEGVSYLPPRPPAKKVPPPMELANRITEATSSAKLLEQLIQSTATNELPENELVKEFGERCRLAQKSLAGYIAVAEDEDVDVDTLATLIETHDIVARAALDLKRRLKDVRKQRGRQQDEGARVPESRLVDIAGDTSMLSLGPEQKESTDYMAPQPQSGTQNTQLQGAIGANKVEPGTPGVGMPTPQREVHQVVPMHGASIQESEELVSPVSPVQEQRQYRIPPPPPPPALEQGKAPSVNDPFADDAHPDVSSSGASNAALGTTTTTTIQGGEPKSGLGRFWKR